MLRHEPGEHVVAGATGAVMHHHPGQRDELRRLVLPVAHHRQGAHDQVRTWESGEVGEGGGCLAEAHVVGQAAAQTDGVQELQPAQTAPLVGAQRGGERGRHHAFCQLGVGEPGEQVRQPRLAHERWVAPGNGVGRVEGIACLGGRSLGRRSVGGQVCGEPQQLQRGHLGVLGTVPIELLERSAGLGPAELDPTAPHLDEVRAGLGGAAHGGLVDRCAVDHHRPVDDGPRAKASVTFGLGPCRAGGARGAPSEACGRDQLDPSAVEAIDRLQRGCRFVERDRAGLGRPVGQPRGGGQDVGDGVFGQLGEQWQPACVTGHDERIGGAEPGVGNRAPPAGVGGVDQLERQRPATIRIVRHAEPESGANHGLALGSPPHGVEGCRDVDDGVEQVTIGTEAWRSGAERLGDDPHGASVDSFGVGERDRPPTLVQAGAHQVVEEGVEDACGHVVERLTAVGRRGMARRHSGRDRSHQLGHEHVAVSAHRGPGGRAPAVVVHDHTRHHAAGCHQMLGDAEHLGEPCHRRAGGAVEGLQLTEFGHGADMQLLAHHVRRAVR